MQAGELLERIRRCAMPDGTIKCRGTWLKQEGEMRLAPDRPWLSFTAEQWFPGGSIDFRWQARVRMVPLLHARVVDAFENGRGMLRARVLGCITVAHASGPAADKAEAMRGLAELPWRPFAVRESPNLTWEATAENKLRVAFDDGQTHASVEFTVDDEGHILGGSAPDRPRAVGQSVVETAWSGNFGDYREFDGMRVPTVAEVSWLLPEGPFIYWRGRVIDFRTLR